MKFQIFHREPGTYGMLFGAVGPFDRPEGDADGYATRAEAETELHAMRDAAVRDENPEYADALFVGEVT